FLAGDLVTARNLFELVDSPMLTGVALAEVRLAVAESLALRHLPESIGEVVLASNMHAMLQTWRAEVALRRGDQFAARQLLVASLQAALLVPLPPAVCFTLPTWAEYLVLAGDGRSASARHATRAAGLALVHPSSTHETKQRA